MRLHDLFEPYQVLHLNEVFDTKIPVDRWWHEGEILFGELHIDDAIYHISFEPSTYSFQTKTYNFINVAFAKFINGTRVQTLTFNKGNPANASKVIGAILNAFYEKLKDYKFDAVTLIATDNVDQRMRIYNAIARWEAKKYGSYLPNIPLPGGGKATILFDRNFDREAHDDFVKFVGTLEK